MVHLIMLLLLQLEKWISLNLEIHINRLEEEKNKIIIEIAHKIQLVGIITLLIIVKYLDKVKFIYHKMEVQHNIVISKVHHQDSMTQLIILTSRRDFLSFQDKKIY